MILDNPRHEAFAQAVASGMSGSEAYRRTYGTKAKNADCLASRLSVKVKDRVAEIQKGSLTSTTLTLQEKREFLANLIRTPIGDVDERSILCQSAEYQVTGGVRGKLRRGPAPSGNETTVAEVTTVRIRMADKLKALELDAKLAGEFSDQPVNVNVSVHVSPEVVLNKVRTLSPALAALGGKN